MENIKKYGYEESDKKIKVELWGLEFEVNNIDKKDPDKLKEVKNNQNEAENLIEEFLGEGAISKINEKRKKDGYEELSPTNELGLIGFLASVYADETTKNTIDRISGTVQGIYNKINNINREQRRYNNRRRNYRRY